MNDLLEIKNPMEKARPEIDELRFNEAIEKLNRATSYPVEINIGRHIMNSITQDMIEKTIREAGFYDVYRSLSSRNFDILVVDYRYK